MTLNKKKQNRNYKANKNITSSYIGFLFQTVLKRPFGYITSILYIVYIAVILLIVPKAVHLNPLFIWSNPAFNMPIFNLIFLAAATSSMAVAVFKTGNEDGTDLLLSTKPITKLTRILCKILVYFIVMIIVSLIITIILALIKPVFGEFSLFNLNGIDNETYKSLLSSMLIGNLINILFFGAIAVLISMIGGQIITLIGTIGVAFILCLLNVLFPLTISSPRSVLSDRYNSKINSIAAVTRNQFNNSNSSDEKSRFACIDCLTKEDGTIVSNFDTYEYWTKAEKESGLKATNYIDIGKQLSNIFSSIGKNNTKLESAKKLAIGSNSSFNYVIDKESKVTNKNNLDKKLYPISVYTTRSNQGYTFPIVEVMGSNMGVAGGWVIDTQRYSYGWNSAIIASNHFKDDKTNDDTLAALNNKPWFNMSELRVTEQEYNQAKTMFDKLLKCKQDLFYSAGDTKGSAISVIIDNNEDVFWTGDFYSLPHSKRFEIAAKIHLCWVVFAQELQIQKIQEYCDNQTPKINDSFPYSSSTIMKWYYDKVVGKDLSKKEFFNAQMQLTNIFVHGICTIKDLTENAIIFTKVPCHTLYYPETYKNLYKYDVTQFFNPNALIVVWSVISIGMFASSAVVYKKTDFK